MPAGRVLATQQARDAANQLLALTGQVKDKVGMVVRQGNILADPHRWDGGLAGKWRNDWSQDASQLRQTAAKLADLERRAHQVVEDIFKTDSGSLGTRSGENESAPDELLPPWIEGPHAVWDALGADSALTALIDHGKAPGEWAEKLPELVKQWYSEDVNALAYDADRGLTSWDNVEAAYGRWLRKTDAAEFFTEKWLGDTKVLRAITPGLQFLKGLTGGAAILGDISVIAHPEDKGTMGWVDRGMAGANMALVTADLVLDSIPGVGEVAMVGTGIFLGGDYLYHHWEPFHNLCDTVGHGTVSVAKTVWHFLGL